MNDDMTFGLSSKQSYAALSPTDLETMGKIAANLFLNGEMSLNDAVVKLAREQPSISTNQVRRVIEFANQEAFQRMFEKNSSDKNIEFPVADPGHILSSLNNSAKPGTNFMVPEEYESGPAKLASADVEADFVIARMFGFDLSSPMAEKTADESTDRIQAQRENSAFPLAGAALSQGNETPNDARGTTYDEEAMKLSALGDQRFAAMAQQPQQQAQEAQPQQGYDQGAGVMPQQQVDPTAQQDPAAQQAGAQQAGAEAQPQQEATGTGGEAAMATDQGGEVHQQRMLGLQREIEYAKKREELAKIQQKMVSAMNPGQAMPGEDPTQAAAQQASAATGQDPSQAAAPTDPNAAGATPDPSQAQAQPSQDMQGQESGQSQAQPQEAEQPKPHPLSGAMTTPPGAYMKTSSAQLTKEAMSYVKAGRPQSAVVLGDLKEAVSLARIKMATAQRANEYPEANPYGDLIRTRQKIAMLKDEAKVAVDTNISMTQEAMDEFVHKVAQHVLSDGSIGEVAHVLENTPGESYLKEVAIKTAMQQLIQHHGMDPVAARADTIRYEMTKKAGARSANPNHPVVRAFLTFHKLAESQEALNQTLETLTGYDNELYATMKEVMRHASSRK
jgi:hypothetical protein